MSITLKRLMWALLAAALMVAAVLLAPPDEYRDLADRHRRGAADRKQLAALKTTTPPS